MYDAQQANKVYHYKKRKKLNKYISIVGINNLLHL